MLLRQLSFHEEEETTSLTFVGAGSGLSRPARFDAVVLGEVAGPGKDLARETRREGRCALGARPVFVPQRPIDAVLVHQPVAHIRRIAQVGTVSDDRRLSKDTG